MQVVKSLKTILPDSSIITSNIELSVYECDGLSAYRQKPLAVVLPTTVAEVQEVVKLCRQHKTPIIARGSGTGLSGGSLPLVGSVVLSLSKMNQVLDINPAMRTIYVQAGVRNLAVTEAVEDFGLCYAPDPSSQIICSIGGNIAENAGGVHCLKYGMTVHNVLELQFVDSDGEVQTVASYDDPGLLSLLIGSEGMLGIVVSAKLKLVAKPETIRLLMGGFPSVQNCSDVLAAIIKKGVIPAGLEMMDKLAIRAAKDFVDAPYPNCEALLLCELDGSENQVALEFAKVRQVFVDFNATDIHEAQGEQERHDFWAGRKSAFPAVGRLSPDYYCMDGTIPKNRLAEVLRKIHDLSRKYNLRVANVFHAGDGNLHPLILYDAAVYGELDKAEKFGADILSLCIDVGGTITGEHGVGIEKLDSMCEQFNSMELAQMHAVKSVFDEDNIFNPGKAVPTLHRCAELGAMHVHNNELPFPEIARF